MKHIINTVILKTVNSLGVHISFYQDSRITCNAL